MRPSHALPIVLAGLLSIAAARAAAQDAASLLFISPMGEPFRAPVTEPYPSATWFAGADANHDGVITRDEFRADALRFFKALDANKDGQISDLEVQRYEYILAPEIIGATTDTSALSLQKDEDDDSPSKHVGLSPIRQGAANFSFLNDAEPVRSADMDLNRRITQQEWMAAADRRYDRLLIDGKDGLRLADLPRPPNQPAKPAKAPKQ